MLPFRQITHSQLVVSAALGSNSTTTANLDTNGADYATIIVNISSEANTNAVGPTIGLLESDDTTASNFATVTANITGDCVAAKPIVYGVDLRGRKRYLRLSVNTATASNDNIVFSADAVLSRLKSGPSGTTGIVSTNGVARFV
tara:strand:+ start:712 stop:1143 length:432 start_codon:yes stop_codon:yes gene_type:complete